MLAALGFTLVVEVVARSGGSCAERWSYPWQGSFSVALVHRDADPLWQTGTTVAALLTLILKWTRRTFRRPAAVTGWWCAS